MVKGRGSGKERSSGWDCDSDEWILLCTIDGLVLFGSHERLAKVRSMVACSKSPHGFLSC